jgi:hypothetical protein
MADSGYNPGVYRRQGGNVLVIGPNGSIETTQNVGAKNGSTVTCVEQVPALHKTVLTLAATPISIADDNGVAQYGGVKIYDFPEGAINILGANLDLSITLGVTGTIINTWAGGVALGSVTASTGASLTSTEADILAEKTVSAATLKVATVKGVSIAAAVTPFVNGTGTPLDCFLNLFVTDDASHTVGTGTITGTVTLFWNYLGDV